MNNVVGSIFNEKVEVCGSRALFTGSMDVLKMAEKSKFSATVHAQYMNSSLCLLLRMQKKKRKKKKWKNAPQDSAENAESKQALYKSTHISGCKNM